MTSIPQLPAFPPQRRLQSRHVQSVVIRRRNDGDDDDEAASALKRVWTKMTTKTKQDEIKGVMAKAAVMRKDEWTPERLRSMPKRGKGCMAPQPRRHLVSMNIVQ